MGEPTILYGFIAGADAYSVYNRDNEKDAELQQKIDINNINVIKNLPVNSDTDEWPFIAQSMFSIANNDWRLQYWYKLIHFAACYKNLDWDLTHWIRKFEEKILSHMYWEYAVVDYRGSYRTQPTYHFEWGVDRQWKDELMEYGSLKKITKWSLSHDYDDIEERKIDQAKN